MLDIKTETLKLLKRSHGYVSGQELCDELGVSRTAIWKYINKLKEEGYQLEAVPNKGYRLLDCPDRVTASEIKSLVDTKWAGSVVFFKEEMDSTNNEAKKLAEQGGIHGTLVVTETQYAGKGRRGRNWSSPSGEAIYMSLLIRPHLNPSCASMLTLVAALAVSEALEEICEVKPQIKWPNDIVLNKKKICGILTEMSAELEEIHYIVIGIGINVNRREFPEEIKNTATSLAVETKKVWKRANIIAAFLRYFERDYEIFKVTDDFHGLKESYENRLVNVGKTVRLIDSDREYTATALGINNSGALLVEREGGVMAVTSGEVSVRGLYGYV